MLSISTIFSIFRIKKKDLTNEVSWGIIFEIYFSEVVIILTNIASMAKVGTISLDLHVEIMDAMASAKIDCEETGFECKGFLSTEQFSEAMAFVSELCEATPW